MKYDLMGDASTRKDEGCIGTTALETNSASVAYDSPANTSEISDTDKDQWEAGEWKPTSLQLRNLYHKHTKMKSDPLAEDTLEMCVFSWARKQLEKRNTKPVSGDYDALLKCLYNLVALKEHKDRHGKDEYYERMQPECWQQAKAVLDAAGVAYVD